jgi:hypothetical protein
MRSNAVGVIVPVASRDEVETEELTGVRIVILCAA